MFDSTCRCGPQWAEAAVCLSLRRTLTSSNWGGPLVVSTLRDSRRSNSTQSGLRSSPIVITVVKTTQKARYWVHLVVRSLCLGFQVFTGSVARS